MQKRDRYSLPLLVDYSSFIVHHEKFKDLEKLMPYAQAFISHFHLPTGESW